MFRFAQAVAEGTGGNVTWLVLGDQIENVVAEASRFAPVIFADSPSLAQPMADSFARVIATIAQDAQIRPDQRRGIDIFQGCDAARTALLGGAMASDVVGHELAETGLQFDCPQYAGAVTATLRLIGSPQVVTVRGSAYPAATADGIDTSCGGAD